ncbi:hypothetical protein HGRIS_004590 [Hohenbuehelia grisea]|uniref:Prokaryotic-type class I peptide chain release factors domain-containing protein n=1 Tax=Hohenbuehelia grisea TaxID=104357 RepID=A0ABR3JE12_9AGAR
MLSLRIGRSCTSSSPLLRLVAIQHRSYTAAKPQTNARIVNSASAQKQIQDIENNASKILRAVQLRTAERRKLRSEMTETFSTAEDIQRMKRLKETEDIQAAWTEWESTRELLNETIALLADEDPAMCAMAQEEYISLLSTLSHLASTKFPELLVPNSSTGHLSALMELKSGVGGSESSLFLSELLRMYMRYANVMNWKAALVGSNELDGGGTKDAIVEITGSGAYDALRWESGVHRVQRVPATETSGRVHTSTVAVVVLPLVEEKSVNAEEDLFSMDDIKLEVMRARGAGGQHVNKTESAVRLTHIPSGITVSMQDERSQHQNRRRAFQVLRARLMDLKIAAEIKSRRDVRRNLVQGADRSEKIRTYNFPQDRITDHRIGLTLTGINYVMEGDGLQSIIDPLQFHHNESVLADMLDEVPS